MSNSNAYQKYNRLFEELSGLIKITDERIREENKIDEFFVNNANYFTKSFLVTMCAYIESYLKDVSLELIEEINKRLENNKIPYNLVRWSVSKETKEDENYVEKDFIIEKIIEERLSDLSASVEKTIKIFLKLGIKLDKNEKFEDLKEKIAPLNRKRNEILHQNDDASDKTPTDLIDDIKVIKDYISVIDEEVMKLIRSKAQKND